MATLESLVNLSDFRLSALDGPCPRAVLVEYRYSSACRNIAAAFLLPIMIFGSIAANRLTPVCVPRKSNVSCLYEAGIVAVLELCLGFIRIELL